MGLLDSLFDPSMYGNQSLGLLSRLQPMLGQYPQSAGFTPANNQPSPLDTMQWPYGPQGAPPAGEINTPSNSQLAQGQALQQPQQLPNFLQQNPGGFGAGIRGFVNNLHTGPIGALIGGIGSGLGMQDQSQQDARALFDAYKGAGLSANQAMLATLNPKLAENLLGLGGTDDIKEYNFAKRENPDLTFEKFMLNKRANTGEYGLQPVYGTDASGNTVLMQMGKAGTVKQSVLPEGVKVSSGVEKIDAGDHWILYDKRTGMPVGQQPKNIENREAAEKVGQARGTAQAALSNGADVDAEQTKKKIDQLLSNEGLDSIVGPLDQYRGSTFLGEKGRDALTRLNQLKGTAFLQAYTMLRGGGAITEIEGKKAEEAMARLDRSQSEADFRQALKDFRDAVDTGLAKLRRAASGGETPAAAPLAPKRIRINADGTLAQ